jgi:hypothetical protein
MFVWIENLIQMFFVRSHEWNSSRTIELEQRELICNIWLTTSLSLVIVWMVFEVYLHFAIYHDDYKFLTNIFFNHLILISKWFFFYNLIFWVLQLLYSNYHLQKTFNISLVEVQKHVVSKSNICDNNLWPP